MKKFEFNAEQMLFEPAKRKLGILTKGLIIYSLIVTFFTVIAASPKETARLVEEIVLTETPDTFSKEKLIVMLKDMNIKFPHIVLAQAVVESNFKSPIFLENHNMFGMTKAFKRPHVQTGTNRGHATYDNWRMSVIDYALYQCYSLKTIKTEEDYLSYLDKHYAEAEYYEPIKNLSKQLKGEFYE